MLAKRNQFKGRDYRRLLGKVECRERKLIRMQRENPTRAENFATTIAWERAFQMATGLKVKVSYILIFGFNSYLNYSNHFMIAFQDNVQLLMKGLKKKESDKERKKHKWECRKQSVNDRREKTIQRRQQNLNDRKSSKRKKVVKRKK